MAETADLTIPFGRLLRLGTVGRDVQGVKRALARAKGTNDPALGTTTLGRTAVTELRAFQRAHGLQIDGVYGPHTHAKLSPSYDEYGFLLYTGKKPPSGATLQLPARFTATHQTAGLPGYPAIDLFAVPGAQVLAPNVGSAMTVRRLSGHDPADGDVGGRVYGWSMYLESADGDRFATHFGTRAVVEGARVFGGDLLGTVCDARAAGLPSSLSHIHLGLKLAV